jgi:hypothetical protein
MATAAPGRSQSLPDCVKSSAAWELGSTARKMSSDYTILVAAYYRNKHLHPLCMLYNQYCSDFKQLNDHDTYS